MAMVIKFLLLVHSINNLVILLKLQLLMQINQVSL